MLTKKDLLLIGEVVETKVEKTVERIIDKKIDSLMEYQIMPQFEYMHEQFHRINRELGIIKNTMVTKSFLEERLDRFRIDHGLSYQK